MKEYEVRIVAAGQQREVAPVTVSLGVGSGDEGVEREWVRFGEFAAMLRRRKWRAGFWILLGGLAGLVLALSTTRVYEARASIEILPPNEDYLNRRLLDPTAGSNPLGMEAYIQTQLKLLDSDALLGSVAREVRLEKQNEFLPREGLRGRLRKALLGGEPAGRSMAALLEQIHDRLKVQLFGQSNIVELRFQAQDPKLAARFVNTLVRDYTNEAANRRAAATRETVVSLTGQLDQMRRSLAQAEQELEAYIREHGPALGLDRENIAEARLRQVQQALSVAHEDSVAQQTRYEQTMAASPDSHTDALENDTLRAYRIKLTDLKQKLAEMTQILKPGHYKVQQQQAEIAELEQAFTRERASILKRLKIQYDAAREREQVLAAEYDRQAREAADQTAYSVRYTSLKGAVETQRQLCEETEKRVKEATVAGAAKVSNLQPVDAAQVPVRPVKPNRPLYLSLGLCAGLLLGVASTAFAERRDRRVEGPLEQVLGPEAVLLGTIPAADGRVLAPNPGVMWRMAGKLLGGHVRYRSAAEEDEAERLGRQHAALAEACRSVLASVRYSDRSKQKPKLIAVTSARRHEGRSALVCNLALAMAQCGRNVLLVDADSCHGQLHEVLGLSNDIGLSNLLEGAPAAMLARANRAIQPTSHPRLFVLPWGRLRPGHISLVDHPRLEELFELLRWSDDYDAVFIDTPAVLESSDARGVARFADAVVFVARAHRSGLDDSKKAFRRLIADGASVAGTVLNDWSDRGKGSGAENV